MKTNEVVEIIGAIVGILVVIGGVFWYLVTIDRTTALLEVELRHAQEANKELRLEMKELRTEMRTLATDLRKEAGVLYLDSELPTDEGGQP